MIVSCVSMSKASDATSTGTLLLTRYMPSVCTSITLRTDVTILPQK